MNNLDDTHTPGLFLVSLPAPLHHNPSALVISKGALPDLCSFFLLPALPQGWASHRPSSSALSEWTPGMPDSVVDLGVHPCLCCWLQDYLSSSLLIFEAAITVTTILL